MLVKAELRTEGGTESTMSGGSVRAGLFPLNALEEEEETGAQFSEADFRMNHVCVGADFSAAALNVAPQSERIKRFGSGQVRGAVWGFFNVVSTWVMSSSWALPV